MANPMICPPNSVTVTAWPPSSQRRQFSVRSGSVSVSP